MLGVVLWSNTNDNKAVIWCEDHGDLAYFNGTPEDHDALLGFDAGDLVQFDLREEQRQRYARNPRRVGQGAYSGIQESLSDTQPIEEAVSCSNTNTSYLSAQVIPFRNSSGKTRDKHYAPA